jgi:hypothetical protein
MFACLLAVGASYEITKFMLVVLRDFRTARTRVRSIGWICATLFLVGRVSVILPGEIAEFVPVVPART